MTSLGDVVARAWQETLAETPSPAYGWWPESGQPTYQEWIDHQPRNYKGELIPRIITVRRNLSLYMRKPKQAPRLPA